MKILAILLSPPVPATAGHRVRNRSLLHALALEGHEVTVAAFAEPEEIASPKREFVGLCHEFHLLPFAGEQRGRPATRRLWNNALRGDSPDSAGNADSWCASIWQKDAFDAILCDDFYLAGNIPEGNHVPVVLNKHDITCRILRQFAAGERNPLKKCYAALEAMKIERLESAVCASAQAVAVCSARDGELLLRAFADGKDVRRSQRSGR